MINHLPAYGTVHSKYQNANKFKVQNEYLKAIWSTWTTLKNRKWKLWPIVFKHPAMYHHHWMVMGRNNPHDSILVCKWWKSTSVLCLTFMGHVTVGQLFVLEVLGSIPVEPKLHQFKINTLWKVIYHGEFWGLQISQNSPFYNLLARIVLCVR